MAEKLVSVVVPVYNRCDTICDAVGSVLNQTYKNLEVIVVDDCSEEDIRGRIESLKDNRIIYYRNEKNMGTNYSRNWGILHAKGEYIGFQDSADIWVEDKLEKQMAVFDADNDVDVVYCETEFVKRDGSSKVVPDKSKNSDDRNKNIYKTLLYTNIIDTPSLVIKKACLIENGMFDTEMPRLQEWELCLRLSKNLKFKCVNEVLSRGTYRSDSISANWEKLVCAGALLVKKHRHEMDEENTTLYNIMKFFRESLSESHNQIGPEELKTEFLRCYGEDLLTQYGISDGVLDDMIREFRFKCYYNIYSALLKRTGLNEKIPFDFTGKTVAIYGYGTLGKILYSELIKENIKPVYIIDNAYNIDAEVPVYRPEDIHGKNLADIIIVTPVYDFIKIKYSLEKLGFYGIVSLETVFMNKC